ncbi:hypothetical protein P3G55_17345 [Leptospira sp. 96542]|nr:hypothetical protein [Leptospira sp. 96542]
MIQHHSNPGTMIGRGKLGLPFLWFSFLSGDVVVSLVANLFYFSHHTGQIISPYLSGFYLLAVWAFYLLDHSLDAKKELVKSKRGEFYKQFQIPINISITMSGILSILCFFFWVRSVGFDAAFPIFFWGIIFILGVVLAEILKLSFPKEIFISLVYVGAILAPFPIRFSDPLIFVFFLHVNANVFYTYLLDAKTDALQGRSTITNRIGLNWTKKIFWMQLILGEMILIHCLVFQKISLPNFFVWFTIYLYLLVLDFFPLSQGAKKSLAEWSYCPLLLVFLF